jgi:hypothetical protein
MTQKVCIANSQGHVRDFAASARAMTPSSFMRLALEDAALDKDGMRLLKQGCCAP